MVILVCLIIYAMVIWKFFSRFLNEIQNLPSIYFFAAGKFFIPRRTKKERMEEKGLSIKSTEKEKIKDDFSLLLLGFFLSFLYSWRQKNLMVRRLGCFFFLYFLSNTSIRPLEEIFSFFLPYFLNIFLNAREYNFFFWEK